MVKFDRHMTFYPEDYEGFEEFIDELFWNDMNLQQDDTYYIHDTSRDIWFSIEYKYHYGNLQQLFREKEMIRFDELKDEDIIEDLKATFYND